MPRHDRVAGPDRLLSEVESNEVTVIAIGAVTDMSLKRPCRNRQFDGLLRRGFPLPPECFRPREKLFTSEEYDTRSALPRMGEDLREIEIVRENDVSMLSGEAQISVSDALESPASDQWSASGPAPASS